MRCEEATLVRFERHMGRLMESARYFGFDVQRAAIEAACMEAIRASAFSDAARVRLVVDRNGESDIDISAAPPRFCSPDASRAAGVVERVSLARDPVSSRDRFLCHKTTYRSAYDMRRDPHTFDTLLWNENDQITEFTIGNVVLEIDGLPVTPPRSCGLLNGVFRQQLLDDGVIVEAVVTRTDIARANRIWLINSLREWVEVTLADLSSFLH
jgi:para-aminobenzoate synthetase/4-amino-4-deoxychorismate lyase